MKISLPKIGSKDSPKQEKKVKGSSPKSESPIDDVMPLVQDDFDVLPPAPQTVVVKSPPAGLLTVDKVLAVRFNRAKEGYVYSQVEAFIEQIKTTLQYLENDKFEKATQLHANAEEINDLNERIQTLQATIEVFRVSGDPVTNTDGSYLTLSQVPAGMEEVMAKNIEIESLKNQLAQVSAEKEEALENARVAWQEEATLRKYIEEDLLPWVKSREALIASISAPVVEAPVVETPVVEAPVVVAPAVEVPVAVAPTVEAPVVEAPVVVAPTVEAPVVVAPAVEVPVAVAPAVEVPVAETPDPIVMPVVVAPVAETPEVELPVEEIDEEVQQVTSSDDGWDIEPEDLKKEDEFIETIVHESSNNLSDNPSIQERKIVISNSRKDILTSSPELAMLAESGLDIDIVEDQEEPKLLAPTESDSKLNPVLALSPEAIIAKEDSLRENS